MTELLARMLAMLTGAYNRHPNGLIGKLFRIFAEGLSSAESTLRTVALWRDVNAASGNTLDRIGTNFGVARDGVSDKFFRLMIKVKMIALLSGGDVNTVIDGVAVLFDIPPAQVDLIEIHPAKVWIFIPYDIDTEYVQYAAQTAGIIGRIISAGVGKRIFFRQSYDTQEQLYAGAGMYQTTILTVPATPIEEE